ncbi:MAG: 50S ribosomal protein L25 [Deltaproteobacteria bacterium]|nr:50S ribosomal protein L25 [Deltaproteobacteria bacterium]
MAHFALAADVRTQKGKEAARKLRNDKRIPAVFYGPQAGPVPLTVSTSDLQGILKKITQESAIIDLKMAATDGNVQDATVMIKELQVDPLRGDYLHADFYEISMDKEITADIGINLVGEPVGVTRGGILQYIRREITISCLPDKLIERLDVDVSGLDIGDAVHIEDIQLPEGISTAQEGHLTVAVVAAPTVEEEAEEEVEEIEGLEEAEAGAEAEEEPSEE